MAVHTFEVDVLHDTAGRGGRRIEGDADARVQRAADQLSASQRHVLPGGHVIATRQMARDCGEVVGNGDTGGGVGQLRRVGRVLCDRRGDGGAGGQQGDEAQHPLGTAPSRFRQAHRLGNCAVQVVGGSDLLELEN